MAHHIIRDSKGRIDKILNDQEYAEHQKQRCYANLIFYGIVIIVAIILLNVVDCEGDKKENTTSKDKTEVVDKEVSSQSETVVVNSTIDGTPPTTEKPTAEPTPEEYETSSEPTFECEPSANEPEQKLSRKERRALRKAQRMAKEEEIEE